MLLARARRASSVVGLEQFELGHARGASHDHSRIIRRSYHTPGYVELAGAAYDAWARVAVEPSRSSIRTGGIDLFPAGAAIPIDDYTRSMDAAGVPFEVLDAAEIMRRWPRVASSPTTSSGCSRPTPGSRAAERATARLRQRRDRPRRARCSATPRSASIRDDGDGDRGRHRRAARSAPTRVVIAADAWTNRAARRARLAGAARRDPGAGHLHPAARTPSQFAPDAFPVWIWMDEPSWYGFPEFGDRGVGQDRPGLRRARSSPRDTRTFDPDPEAEALLLAFLRDALPGASTGETITKTCLYTLTPDRDFVLDAVPGHPDVFVALGAAHGFKFAAVFGEIMRDLVTRRAVAARSGCHSASTATTLTTDHPVRAWLV